MHCVFNLRHLSHGGFMTSPRTIFSILVVTRARFSSSWSLIAGSGGAPGDGRLLDMNTCCCMDARGVDEAVVSALGVGGTELTEDKRWLDGGGAGARNCWSKSACRSYVGLAPGGRTWLTAEKFELEADWAARRLLIDAFRPLRW